MGPESAASVGWAFLNLEPESASVAPNTAGACPVPAATSALQRASAQPRSGVAQAMGKHFSPAEIDRMHALRASGSPVLEVQRLIAAARRRARKLGPSLTSVRRVLKGKTWKRSATETRGRRRLLTATNLRSADRARKELIAKAKGEAEVHWDDVVRASRIPHVHRTTLAKNMAAAGYGVGWRVPRLKPSRSEIGEVERKDICGKLRRRSVRYWLEEVDALIDCKDGALPLTVRGKSFLKKVKVRGHLRTKREGLKKHFTKPDKKKHRVNTGGHAKLCAAIIGGRVRVWQYLPRRWSGAAAADFYTRILAPALKKYRGEKRRYVILEDNDPTGFKSRKGIAAKRAAGIETVKFPKYSPDLNPLDYSLWEEVEARLAAQRAPARESAKAFKARLRAAALSIPMPVVQNMIKSIKSRAQSIYDNDGGHIPRD